NGTSCQPVQQQQETLQQRLRAVGVVLLTCNEQGDLLEAPDRGDDWLHDLFCSDYFRDCLKSAATKWSNDEMPALLQPFDGVWLAPTELLCRRRRSGYSIAVIPTSVLLEADELAALCQSASTDVALCRSLLSQLPPAAPTDVPRLAALVRLAHEDQARL